MLIKVDYYNLAALFLGRLKTCRNTPFPHDSFTVSQLAIDGVFWILVPQGHRMGIDDDGHIGKGVKDCSRSTNVTAEFSLVGIHANQQTLTKNFILNVICMCIHIIRCKDKKYF